MLLTLNKRETSENFQCANMPYDEVMHKWKKGKLHSGSKKGPKVTSRKQAIAIMLSEKRKAEGSNKEYKSKKLSMA